MRANNYAQLRGARRKSHGIAGPGAEFGLADMFGVAQICHRNDFVCISRNVNLV